MGLWFFARKFSPHKSAQISPDQPSTPLRTVPRPPLLGTHVMVGSSEECRGVKAVFAPFYLIPWLDIDGY